MSLPPEDAAPPSVVIVNYQSYDELRNCLTSLQGALDCPPVIVVDHSTDAREADALSRDYPEVRLLRSDSNGGFASGVNRGARESTSPVSAAPQPRLRRRADHVRAARGVDAGTPRRRRRRSPAFTTRTGPFKPRHGAFRTSRRASPAAAPG